MDVQLPDGTILRDVPEGTTKAQIAEKLKANGRAVPAEWLAASAPAAAPPDLAVKAGGAIMEVPRQVGLTARAGLKAAAAVPAMLTDAVTGIYNAGADAVQSVVGGQRGYRFKQQMPLVENALTQLGLPEPATPTERVAQDAASMMAGAGGMAKASDLAARGAAGITRNVLAQMAARPGVQIAGAGAAGMSGGSVREAGGSPMAQFAASLGGGVAGGLAADKLIGAGNALSNAVRSTMTPKTEQIRAADQQINLVLERSGVDWSAVPERIRQGLREEVAQAMNTGQPLNADALRRLVAFRRTGTQPTVGQLTQDPVQITAEMNLAKTGANSTDKSLQRLPGLQNQNTAALLRQLDEAGASGAPSSFQTGERVIGALQGREAAAQANIDRLYSAARDTSGRSAALDGYAFTRRANEALDEAMVGGALPKDVANTMNKIARGEMPFTVEIAEQIKTRIGALQRATSDGSARMALGVVRRALDETPIQSQQVNPGNLPAVPGTVPPSVSGVADESIAAFNAARAANRQWMQRVENNPALRAVVEGAEPDQFVQRFVLGRGATAADLRALRGELERGINPQNLPVPYDPARAANAAPVGPDAIQSIRQFIVSHLKSAATNNTDDITKFSNSGYRGALREIGDEKLAVFFSPQEIQQLKAVGDAAKYMQAQPAGSAVNNSNSGALMLGRGLDVLDRIAGYIPLGGRDIIKGAIQGAQQTQVLRPQNALVQIVPRNVGPSPMRVNPLLAASVVSPTQAAENERRN